MKLNLVTTQLIIIIIIKPHDWGKQTKQCCLARQRRYIVADWLSMVTSTTETYSIENGRQSWLTEKQRICNNTNETAEPKNEVDFILKRNCEVFGNLTNDEKAFYL